MDNATAETLSRAQATCAGLNSCTVDAAPLMYEWDPAYSNCRSWLDRTVFSYKCSLNVLQAPPGASLYNAQGAPCGAAWGPHWTGQHKAFVVQGSHRLAVRYHH